MQLSALKKIAKALQDSNVEYLLVGGLAVVAHGYGRMTHDIDLVVNFSPKHLLRAFQALNQLGYRPRVPITGEQFADTNVRYRWITQKGMMVLNMTNDLMPHSPIDLFVKEPFPFDKVYRKAIVETFNPNIEFRYVDLDTLISMKKEAGRPKDLNDIEQLEKLRHEDLS
jgi:predicted nucleotidyltransferase